MASRTHNSTGFSSGEADIFSLMLRAIGFTRAEALSKNGGRFSGNAAFAHRQTDPDPDLFLLTPPGMYIDHNGNVCSIGDAMLDTVFDDKSFNVKSFSHVGIMETALQMYGLLPNDRSKDYGTAAGLIQKLNDSFGHKIFTRLRVNQPDTLKGMQSHESVNKIMYDSVVTRPWNRGIGKKTVIRNADEYCAHCFRKNSHTTPIKPLFTKKAAHKRYCRLCIARFKGKTAPSFALTAAHFKQGKVLSSAASRKIINPGLGPTEMTALQAVLHLFEKTDVRELVAYTDKNAGALRTADERILFGTLRMAMPMRKFFRDGKQKQRTSLFKTLAAIFKECPDRAVALWDLEQKTSLLWSNRDWDKLDAVGRMLLRGPQHEIDSMLQNDFIGRCSQNVDAMSPTELMVCFDTAPPGRHLFPVVASATSAYVLRQIFVQKCMKLHIVLESHTLSTRPPGTDIANLNFKHQKRIGDNYIVLSNAELLTYDLLHWIMDRKCIWGQTKDVTVEVRGNYAAAVQNMATKLYGYYLGAAFVELADAAMSKKYDTLTISIDPMYTPEREPGAAGRCAEIEVAAFYGSDVSHDAWPPALPYPRKKPEVPLGNMITLLQDNDPRCSGWALHA